VDAGANASASPRWPWLLFALAATWSVVIRIPLIVNASNHLDSDLAVDGLTLLEAVGGHWRWHYPGTPFIGIGPVLLSLPQALVFGPSPITLVSGGTVAALLLLLATFVLAWRAFGPRVAAWSLVPLTFASNGTVWLSGRITGGHLIAAVWHAGAFALLVPCLHRPGWRSALALGIWCGLGLYLDSMFLVTLAGLLPVWVLSWLASGAPRHGLVPTLGFVAGFVLAAWPRPVGTLLEPHDAYRGQFAVALAPSLVVSHSRLLVLDCLPRLISGHKLPGGETDPDPRSLTGPSSFRRTEPFDPLAGAVLVISGALGVTAAFRLVVAAARPDGVSRTVALGLVLSAVVTVAGFVVNRNIFNSDNYRYLVSLLVPWSIGFGLVMEGIALRGRVAIVAASICSLVFAGLMTADLNRWYARFGWVDAWGLPVEKPLDDPTLAWLDSHPEFGWIEGGYWDVYRLSFLTEARVRGAPFRVYPNRFPEWRPTAWQRTATIVRNTPEGRAFQDAAIRSGSRVASQSRGVTILAEP
jgi:hypothetical protein